MALPLVRVAVTGAASVLLTFPAPAYADFGRVKDPDDVAGRLDLARVSHKHVPHKVRHTIRMQAGWRASVLKAGDLTVSFKSGARYQALDVGFRRKELVGRLCTDERLTGGGLSDCTRDVGLSRPDGRSLRFVLTKKQLRKPGRDGYKWQVTTFLESQEGDCPRRTLCVDELPGADPWIRHGLRQRG